MEAIYRKQFIKYSCLFLLIANFILIFPHIIYADQIKIWLKVFGILNNISIRNDNGLILNKNNSKKYTILDFNIKKNILYCNGEICSSALLQPIKNNQTRFTTKYGEKIYDGSFYITLKDDRFYIINSTSLTNYLTGVIGSELGESFSIETLKAQAIASRTYFLIQKKKSAFKDVDACDTAGQFQAYSGQQFSGAKSIQAVMQTENLILFNKDPDFIPYFHSTCGGMLLTPDESWLDKPITSIPGFRRYDSINERNNCNISPFNKWSAFLRKNTICNALSKQLNIKIKDIKFIFNDYGFLENAILTEQDNSIISIKGFQFKSYLERELIKEIRSTRFKVFQWGPFLYFRGNGFGHFVGMCQWGAEGMARQGYSYKDILQFYYPDSVIVNKK
jgi:stage II sporulation protein D